MATKVATKKKVNFGSSRTFDEILRRRGPRFYEKFGRPSPKLFLALNLLDFRLKKGWTQVQTAKKADLSFNTYVNIEQAQPTANPTAETLIKLAENLGVSVAALWQERKVNFDRSSSAREN